MKLLTITLSLVGIAFFCWICWSAHTVVQAVTRMETNKITHIEKEINQ